MNNSQSSPLEAQISNLADQIIEEGKTGYNWSDVDDLLTTELGLAGASRCKRANSSGRAANVLTESNDKDISLYVIFVQSPYTIEQFKRVARERMARFPNVRAVAVADRSDGTWRVKSYLERHGERISSELPRLKTCFPLLDEVGAMEWLPAFGDDEQDGKAAVSIEATDFADKVAVLEARVPPESSLLENFEAAIQRQALNVPRSIAADLLACCLSGQLILLAGPSGTGKSRLARCTTEFFAPEQSHYTVEARRQLIGPEDIAGYYSNITERYAVGSDTVGLIQLHEAVMSPHGDSHVPFVTIEEANLSPIEGYLAPVVHGLGAPSASGVLWKLHSAPTPIEDKLLSVDIPPTAFLGPYPRFLATINVDASALAPARKVVSRSLVVLLEPEEVDSSTFVAGICSDDVEVLGTPDGAEWIGDPAATARASESAAVEMQVEHYLQFMRDVVPSDPLMPSYRDLTRAAYYMSNYVALLSDCSEDYDQVQLRQAAAENAFLHIALPLLGPGEFGRAVKSLAANGTLSDGDPGGLLKPRIVRLQRAIDASLFSEAVDFWMALS